VAQVRHLNGEHPDKHRVLEEVGIRGKGEIMSAGLMNIRGGTPRSRGNSDGGKRPRVILAGFAFAERVADQLRHRGWDVHTADTADAAAALAAHKRAAAVLIPAENTSESGYLSCAKMLRTRPNLTVVLVGRERTEQAEQLSKFVGGTFAPEATLADEVAKLVV